MKVPTAVTGVLSRVFPAAGRARRALMFFFLPAIVVIGLVGAVITLAPEPSVAGVRHVSSASIAENGALGASLARISSPARNTAPVNVQASDLKARAAGIQAAEAAAQAALDHKFHLEHLAHLRYLKTLKTEAEQAAAAKAAALAPKTRVTEAAVTPAVTPAATPAAAPAPAPEGDYSCSALESLWESAGGNPGAAFMAAEIATAESGGDPQAISPTDDYGLWQINASNAPGEEMLNPYANVREAISLSGDGSDWGPWTTYTSGAYEGRC